MFSPKHPPSGEALLNPSRKRTRQTTSRPASRTTSRHERSGSSQSTNRSAEVSAAPTRQNSLIPGSQEGAFSRRGPSGHLHKDHNNGEVDWTKNDKYRVSKLLGSPPVFKSSTSNNLPVTASTESKHGYALMLSHTGAYCWRYTAPTALPHTYSFPLPPDEGAGLADPTSLPFPLGTIVSPSANSKEPGLVVVMPMTGRVAYWDAIGSAVAEGLFTKKRGVEGKVPIVSGETVTAICSAEPAGFILSLSSGRLAHLALRDNAGRPGVNVTILRGNGTGMMSGFFGALRAGSSRRDIVAVRAGKELRVGEREIVVGTARGNFSRWHVNRSGAYANVSDVDLREDILTHIEKSGNARGRSRDQFMILDLDVGAYSPSADSDEEDLHVVVLGAYLPDADHITSLYSMVDIRFTPNGSAHIGNVYSIKTYTNVLEASSSVKPRLYLPKPAKTAFVVFPRAVVIISSVNTTVVDEDGDVVQQTELFEDVVDFRGDINIDIVGSGSEDVVTDTARTEMSLSFGGQDQAPQTERLKNPGVVLVAKGAGIVRVEAFDVERKRGPRLPVTVESKLEQAVFYGIKENNPLNFKGRKEVKYAVEELEKAALKISKEILGTANPYQPTLASSLSEHLKGRATYLRALVEHLQTGAFGRVSELVMWKLLSDAEKCEAARAVYNVWDKSRGEEDERAAEGLLENIIKEYLPLDPSKVTGDDPVRSWFTKEIDNIGSLLPYVKKSLVHTSKGATNNLAVAASDAEANEIVTGALMAAWKFRVRSADLYGIRNINQNGLLGDSNSFPAPWTSSPGILQALSDQHELSTTLLKSIINPKLNEDPSRLRIAEKISEQLVDLAEICCRAFEERADWCDHQPKSEEAVHVEGQTVRERYLASRGSWIKPLVTYNRTELAYATAEKWLDFETLVEICSEQMMHSEVVLSEPNKHSASAVTEAKATKSETTDRLVRYFNTFGQPFAETMYTYLITHSQPQKLLDGFEPWRDKFLTPFLRSSPAYAKLSWIHDIHLNEYSRAATTLQEVAAVEQDLSYQTIELSIAKLSALAENPLISTEPLDAALAVTSLQSRVFAGTSFIHQTAMDTDAAVQLATDHLAHHLRRKPALRNQFRTAFRGLVTNRVLSPPDLAELLSLIKYTKNTDWLGSEQFYEALVLVATAPLTPSVREVLEKNIWRRIYINDDWTQISNTKGKSDEQTQEEAHGTALWRTLVRGYAEGFFSEAQRPRGPGESAFGEEPGEVMKRFPDMDQHDLMEVGNDWMQENKNLETYVRKAGLEEWFAGLVVEVTGERGVEEDSVMEG